MKMAHMVLLTVEGFGNNSNGGDEDGCDSDGDGGDSDTVVMKLLCPFHDPSCNHDLAC